jgi:FLVCR family MFS transporter
MLGSDDERGKESLLPSEGNHEQYEVYWIRWWVLFIVSFEAMLQGWFWNIFGPISPAVQPVFGWNDAQIALLPNWGTIGWFIAVAPFSYVMDRQGLRTAVITATALVFAGSVMRCITTSSPEVTWVIDIAQLLNGLAGPCGCSAPPLLSAMWFAPNQRTTATSISTVCNYLGVAFSFVVGPFLVPKLKYNTDHYEATKHHYLQYMWGCTFVSGALLVAVILTFPNMPPKPPCPSAAVERTDFKTGLHQLMRSSTFWICALSYGSITGVYSGWGAVMADNLKVS